MGAHESPGGSGDHPQRRITAVGIYTLLQSALVISGAAVGVTSISCSDISTRSTPWRAVFFYYFRGDCSFVFKVNATSYRADERNNPSERTEIMLWVYIGLNIAWFIASVLLLVSAAKGKHLKPSKGKFLHFVWIFTTILALAYDCISTIIYLVDLSLISDDEGLRNFLSIQPIQYLDFQKNIPPLIMAALFSKGVVLWLVDFILIFVIWRQFVILQDTRHQNQWAQVNKATTPLYLLPPELQQDLKPGNGLSDIHTIPTLPRFTNVNGKFIGSNQSELGLSLQNHRPSALQKAARQGFNYEDPTSRPWSTSMDNPMSPSKSSSFQEFSYGGHLQNSLSHGYPQNHGSSYGGLRNSPSHRNRDRPASLQKDIDVFY